MKLKAVAGILLTAALSLLLLAGCRGDNNNSSISNASSPPVRQPGTESNTTAPPAQPGTRPQTPPTETQVNATAAASENTLALPVADAARFRDQLLELARSVPFDAQASASANADAVRAAWLKRYPNLKFSLFYSMAADPQTVSVSDTFLISGAPGNYDQLYAFSVSDTKGNCAGGALVIPGDNTNHKVSNQKLPTVFKSIDMSAAKSCTGEAVGDNYKP
ncbi:MAG TPA: hypothetical protein VGC64_08735 [Pyrinomonadaceae bacterium]